MGRRAKQCGQAEHLALMIRALASRARTINDLAQEFEVARQQLYLDLIEKEGQPLSQRGGPESMCFRVRANYLSEGLRVRIPRACQQVATKKR
jgi:hypothetical protein